MEYENKETDVRFILSKHFNINDIGSFHRINEGYGSECFYISNNNNAYILKLTERNNVNNPDQAHFVHKVLSEAGIPVSIIHANTDGEFVTHYKEKDCQLQSYIKGSVLQQNTAPEWFMVESPSMLGRIHKALESIPLLNEGMGERFLSCLKTSRINDYYEDSLQIALKNNQYKIVTDIEFRISILDSVNKIEFDLSKFTLKNTHGDYKISQIICGKDKFNAVIDIDACVHPICWEIIRSYTYADPECIYGNINIENFKRYVESYLKISELNKYDLKMMPYFYYFQLAVCNYFGQYYGMKHPNKELLLENAHWSTSLCRWFEHNIQILSDQLVAAF